MSQSPTAAAAAADADRLSAAKLERYGVDDTEGAELNATANRPQPRPDGLEALEPAWGQQVLHRYADIAHLLSGNFSSHRVDVVAPAGEPQPRDPRCVTFVTRYCPQTTAVIDYAFVWSHMRHPTIERCVHEEYMRADNRCLYVIADGSTRSLSDCLEDAAASAAAATVNLTDVLLSVVSACYYLHCHNFAVGALAILPQRIAAAPGGLYQLRNGLRYVHECEVAQTIDIANGGDDDEAAGDFCVAYMRLIATRYQPDEWAAARKFVARTGVWLLATIIKLAHTITCDHVGDMTADVPDRQSAPRLAAAVQGRLRARSADVDLAVFDLVRDCYVGRVVGRSGLLSFKELHGKMLQAVRSTPAVSSGR